MIIKIMCRKQIYFCTCQIPCALGCRAYLSVGWVEGEFCVECLGVSSPPSTPATFHCLSGCGGSWLGCQVLPSIGAVSILQMTTDSGSSRMSQAPKLHLAMQLLM